MIANIAGVKVSVDNQWVSKRMVRSIAISAENRRLERKYQGIIPAIIIVAVKVTAIPVVAIARLMP